MSKLRITLPAEEKPVNLRVQLSAALYRDIELYAEILSVDHPGRSVEPQSLIAPMLENFITNDRSFREAKKRRLNGASP
ncbi:DUF2274 domain-containing protein [uncultured Bartonella sp.]|uniref:DUF2274 domain-containing protein n=1 Tax=uncultured Bartonella sp. TaxID=104108 RepID=UPI0026022466|nr:DUF2274 domain-containing protein [uncultured Bartonella sp.]